MKTALRLLVCLTTLACTATFAQPAEKSAAAPAPVRQLTKFNLNFPGGTPVELAASIQKALGRPLNVIVPLEFAAKKLPPLKMTGVDAAQLFAALEQISPQTELIASGNNSYTTQQSTFGFATDKRAEINDDSIWTFFVTGQINGRLPFPAKTARFYLLTPYLEAGLTVDDITTAIQTGWTMQGNTSKDNAQLSFHKETKLLIAVSDRTGLEVIESVLRALDAVRVKAPAAAADKTTDAKKTNP